MVRLRFHLQEVFTVSSNDADTTSPFADAYASLDWADAQVDMISHDVATFLESNPYEVTRGPDEDGISDAIYMKLCKPVPHSIAPKVATAIQAQRNSLDYLAVALAESNGATRTDDVYFPICKEVSGFSDQRTLRRIKRLATSDKDAILALKPYKGGNNYLFALHWLNRETKHQRLAAFGGASQLAGISGPGRFYGIRTFNPVINTENSQKIAITNRKTDVNLHFSIDIKFREVAGEQVRIGLVPLLHTFSQVCREIVTGFDTFT